MKSLFIGIILIYLLQAQESKSEIKEIEQTTYSLMDCSKAGGTIVFNEVRFGCNKDTSEIKILNNLVMCQKNDAEEWYIAKECKQDKTPDYCNYWEDNKVIFKQDGWEFGCNKSTSGYVTMYKSREGNTIALCNDGTLAQICHYGSWAESSTILQFMTSSLILLLGLVLF